MSKNKKYLFAKNIIESYRKKNSLNPNKLTPLERIENLFDRDLPIIELGSLINYPRLPISGNVILKIGYINNNICICVCSDYTYKAGATFQSTVKKIIFGQKIALKHNLPIIYLWENSGIFLPEHESVFNGVEGFGRIFYYNSLLSNNNILQICGIFGKCIAGGAYLPMMCDETYIVKNEGSIAIAGPHLVKSSIGERTLLEDLGGAKIHYHNTGIIDYESDNDMDCIKKIKKNFIHNKSKRFQNIDHIKTTKKLTNTSTKEIIEFLSDKNSYFEYKSTVGKTVLCGTSSINDRKVGIVANFDQNIKKDNGEIILAKVLYPDSINKIIDFISLCNKKNIPIIFLHDINGFMLGSKVEKEKILKYGAELLRAISLCKVPKISLIIGNSFGAGHYAMCGKAMEPNFIFALPDSQIGVMGNTTLKNTLLNMNKTSEIKKIENKNSILYAASNLWIDEIISTEQVHLYLNMVLDIISEM